jgi:hypothetical protein
MHAFIHPAYIASIIAIIAEGELAQARTKRNKGKNFEKMIKKKKNTLFGVEHFPYLCVCV